MNFEPSVFAPAALSAVEPFGLAVALALWWCASFLALQLAQRSGGADQVVHRSRLVSGGVTVGVGFWAAALCALVAIDGHPPAALSPLRAAVPLLAALALAGVSLLAALAGRALHRLAAAAVGAAALLAMQLAWAWVLGMSTPWPVVAAMSVAALCAQAALVWPLVRWHRDRRRVSARRTALAASLATGVAMLPFMALAMTMPLAGRAAPAPPGIELLLALLAAMMLALALKVMPLDRRLSKRHERLQERLRQATADLERTPLSDPLTSLPNRLGAEALVRAAAMRAESQGCSAALLHIGLDGFRSVNDSYGHGFGDAVLRDVAKLLDERAGVAAAGALHAACKLARVGGDEFALILEGRIDRPLLAGVASALLDALKGPLQCEGREVTLSASIGIACFPQDGGAPKLLHHAEAAMQAAKEAGGCTYIYFEARMQDDARERMDLLRDLRHAVEQHQLELVYQPKIDAHSGQVTAAEALLRWHHPTRGTVSPGVFIPIAERYGLIGVIGNWVIEDACRQAEVWREAGLKMRVAINLSAFQMRQGDLVDRIQAALKRHGIRPSRLTCEITESVAMEDTQVTHRTFERLGEAGIHLSIDDFGTGYSSLAYLRRLPAEELKIDRSFVMDLEHSADARAIVDAVIKLAHAIGLKVVAEGVETERQRDILLGLGCDEFQGFLFARPMSARALQLWAVDDDTARTAFRASLFAETDSPTLPQTQPGALQIERISLD